LDLFDQRDLRRDDVFSSLGLFYPAKSSAHSVGLPLGGDPFRCFFRSHRRLSFLIDCRRQKPLLVGRFAGSGFAALHAAQPGPETGDNAGVKRQ